MSLNIDQILMYQDNKRMVLRLTLLWESFLVISKLKWIKTIQEHKFLSLSQIINTYTEAVQTVDPQLAAGKLHTLWIGFAKFYEDAGQVEDVRILTFCCRSCFNLIFLF